MRKRKQPGLLRLMSAVYGMRSLLVFVPAFRCGALVVANPYLRGCPVFSGHCIGIRGR